MEAVLQAVPANVALPPASGPLPLPASRGTSQSVTPTTVFAGIVQEILKRTAPEGNSGALQPLQSGNAKRAGNGSVETSLGAVSLAQAHASLGADSIANVGLLLNLLASIAPPQVPPLPVAWTPENAGNQVPVNGNLNATTSDTVSPPTGPKLITTGFLATVQDANPNPGSRAQLAAPIVREAVPSSDLVRALTQSDASANGPSAPNVQVLANLATAEKQDPTKAPTPGPRNLSAAVSSFMAIVKQVELLQTSAAGAPPATVAIASKPIAAASRDEGAAQGLQTAQASQTAMAPAAHQPALAADSLKGVAASASEKIALETIHGVPGRTGMRNDSSPDESGTSGDTPRSSIMADLAKQESGTFSQQLAAVKDTGIQTTNIVQLGHLSTPTLNAGDSASNAALPPTPTKAGVPAQPTLPGDVPAWSASRSVNDAQLTQSASHSDMRIAMQTDQLGTIELHARVAGDQLGAAITVERHEVHSLLAAELPALQQALSEKQLRVDQLSLLQGSLHSTAGDSGAPHQQQERAPCGQPTGIPFVVAPFTTTTVGNSDQGLMFDSSGRLSVRA
jgi:hypothetical protein